MEDRHVDNIPANFREQQSSEYNCRDVLPTVMGRDVTRRFGISSIMLFYSENISTTQQVSSAQCRIVPE